MWQKVIKSIQERVSSLFYSHGLFCASHPFAIISLVITIILITRYVSMSPVQSQFKLVGVGNISLTALYQYRSQLILNDSINLYFTKFLNCCQIKCMVNISGPDIAAHWCLVVRSYISGSSYQ